MTGKTVSHHRVVQMLGGVGAGLLDAPERALEHGADLAGLEVPESEHVEGAFRLLVTLEAADGAALCVASVVSGEPGAESQPSRFLVWPVPGCPWGRVRADAAFFRMATPPRHSKPDHWRFGGYRRPGYVSLRAHSGQRRSRRRARSSAAAADSLTLRRSSS
jgi:hypothetical protein